MPAIPGSPSARAARTARWATTMTRWAIRFSSTGKRAGTILCGRPIEPPSEVRADGTLWYDAVACWKGPAWSGQFDNPRASCGESLRNGRPLSTR